MRIAWLGGGIALATISGCRFSYELLSDDERTALAGSGGESLSGDGDGDASLGGSSEGGGGLSGDGDSGTGSGASSAGGNGTGAPLSVETLPVEAAPVAPWMVI